ncbi:MAG: hypothetical protein CL607_16810 [Anaerolineaceae bacterium]|nr:hypothetical protein [Anaerolineaceae bacterium]
MERYTLKEAHDQLGKLIDDAQEGNTVVIVDENERAVQLVPLATSSKPRQAGTARNRIRIAADFDAPLEDFGSNQ